MLLLYLLADAATVRIVSNLRFCQCMFSRRKTRSKNTQLLINSKFLILNSKNAQAKNLCIFLFPYVFVDLAGGDERQSFLNIFTKLLKIVA